MTSMIRVRREKSAWANRFRAFRVVVNGVERTTVKNGSTVDIPIEPGQFSVQARIAWCGSPTMTSTVEDEQTVTVVVGNRDTSCSGRRYHEIPRHQRRALAASSCQRRRMPIAYRGMSCRPRSSRRRAHIAGLT